MHVTAAIFVLACAAHAAADQPDRRDTFFTTAMLPLNVQPEMEEKILRSRAVHVNLDFIHALDWNDIGTSLDMNFFEDAILTAVFNRHVRRTDERFTWIGSLHEPGNVAGDEQDTAAWFITTVHDGVMIGNFWTADGRSFEVRPAGEGLDVYFVHETIQDNYPQCETCAAQAVGLGSRLKGDQPSQQQQLGSCGEDDGSIIDLIVFYTPAARTWAGGSDSAASALVHASVDATNNAFNNSQVNTQMRLVHYAETDYTESGNNSTDLNRLRSTSGLYMPEVHPLRDEYGADLVALINYAPNSNSCGVAYLMTNLSTGFASSAFSVTRSSCAVGNLTFAHELGHNMGCAHDRDNAGTALFAFSYGHRWTTTGGNLRRSVMAYSPGSRVPHFSNPEVLNGGTPTGIAHPHPQSADNAQSINLASWTVANFRQSICAAPDNDLCDAPFVVGEGEHAFSNIGASTDGPIEGGICSMSADVWFGHIAQCNGDLTVSTCGSNFNTVIAVYDANCPTQPGQHIACNSSHCGQQSQVTIPVTFGQAIRIRVGGSGGAEGTGVLNITCTPTTPPCPADITGTGVVDVSDLLQLLAAWGECTGCAEDINGDGTVDVSDLLELLASWGACPSA